MSIPFRALGRSGLQVSPICFGGNVFGWTVDEKTTFELLDAWVDAGFNFVDTADVYSRWIKGHTGGESETLIGRWFKASGKRHRVVLATKIGKPMGVGPEPRQGLSAAYIRAEVEESLKRLQTDVIDLYQSHDDDAQTPLEETLGAFADLIRAGKVRAIGASNHTAPRLAEALATATRLGLPRYESLQPLYNLYERQVFEADLQPLCVREGVGVINFFALASGFLSGKYRSEADAGKSKRGPGIVAKYLTPRGHAILAALDAVAARYAATPAQVALAWLLAKPGITSPIASATTIGQLEQLVAAASLRLDAASLAALDTASAETAAPAA